MAFGGLWNDINAPGLSLQTKITVWFWATAFLCRSEVNGYIIILGNDL